MSPLERISCCADDVVAGLESQMRWLVGRYDVAGDGVDWCEAHPREMKVVLTLSMEPPSVAGTAGSSVGEVNIKGKTVKDDSVIAHMIEVRERCALAALVDADETELKEKDVVLPLGRANKQEHGRGHASFLNAGLLSCRRFVETRFWVLELERLMARTRRCTNNLETGDNFIAGEYASENDLGCDLLVARAEICEVGSDADDASPELLLSEASTKTSGKGAAGEHSLRFMMSEVGTKTCELGADAAPWVHSRAGEKDLEHTLSETSTKACEAGTDVAPSVPSWVGEKYSKHKLEAGAKACVADAGVGDLVRVALASGGHATRSAWNSVFWQCQPRGSLFLLAPPS